MGKGNKLTIVFVIGGEEFPVETNVNTPIHVARDQALKDAESKGRPPEQWDIKTADGKLLDPGTKVNDLGIKNGDKLYLSPKVSGGGCC